MIVMEEAWAGRVVVSPGYARAAVVTAVTNLVVDAALLEESELHVDQALGPGVAALSKARLERVSGRPDCGLLLVERSSPVLHTLTACSTHACAPLP